MTDTNCVWFITGAARGMGVDLSLDITDPAAAQAAVDSSVDRFGRIDTLVNNAGNFYAGFFEEISDSQFRAQMEANFLGPLNVPRAVLPVMRQQRSGKVVTITSTAGIVGGEVAAAYAASKFALEGIPRYGHRSDPQRQEADSPMTASVGYSWPARPGPRPGHRRGQNDDTAR